MKLPRPRAFAFDSDEPRGAAGFVLSQAKGRGAFAFDSDESRGFVLSQAKGRGAFAFDLDETLVDCEPQHTAATRELLDARRIDHHAAIKAFGDTTGARTRDILEAFRRAAGLSAPLDELLEERCAAFRLALAREPPLALPGAVDCVRACRERGPVALVTSGYRGDVLATVEAIGLAEAFDVVVTGEDVLRAKPDPQPYVVAAERLGVAPAELVVFEDSVRGVGAARAAGCRVVAVPNASSTASDEVAGAADVVLASLDEALPLEALFARLGLK